MLGMLEMLGSSAPEPFGTISEKVPERVLELPRARYARNAGVECPGDLLELFPKRSQGRVLELLFDGPCQILGGICTIRQKPASPLSYPNAENPFKVRRSRVSVLN